MKQPTISITYTRCLLLRVPSVLSQHSFIMNMEKGFLIGRGVNEKTNAASGVNSASTKADSNVSFPSIESVFGKPLSRQNASGVQDDELVTIGAELNTSSY